MFRGSARRHGPPLEIVSLGREHMGVSNALYYAPTIPLAKAIAARAAHAIHLPDSEPILILHDATLFGGATNGFLVTTERLCWKNFFEQPHQMAWSEIEPSSVLPESGCVRIGRGLINVLGESASSVARFVAEVAARHRMPEMSPYRSHGGAEAEMAHGGAVLSSWLTAIARRCLGEIEDVYYHPFIPPSKLRKARAVHASHLASDEVAAVLYDDTAFGSAEEGFLITSERLCWKNLTSDAGSAAWRDVDPDSVSANGNVVYVMSSALQLTARVELAAPVASLLVAIAREARRDKS